MKASIKTFSIFLFLLFMFLAGCSGLNGQQGPAGPTMPVIQSLSVVGLPAIPGSNITTTVIAQSAQNLALTYTWTVTSPWIVSPSIANSQTATITAPCGYAITGTATVKVSDTNGMYAIGVVALSTQGDTAPVINSITASPNPTTKGGSMTVSVSASDQEGNALTFTWTVPAGWAISSGQGSAAITLTAPGTYASSGIVGITVSDNYGESAAGQIAIGTIVNSAPIIETVSILPQPVYTAANLLCSAYDPDGDALTYNWSIGGVAVTTGSNALWYSPGIPGYYAAGISVSDGNGGVTNAISSIMIAGASPWPKFHRDIQSTGLSPINTSSITGTTKWSYATGNVIYSSPTISADGTIYVGSSDNSLYAINPDGTKKWSYATGNGIYSSPAIGADGTIYVGSYDHSLYAINPDGTRKWSYATGNGIYSSPAIGADGTIYVGSWDGSLYAIH